MYFTINRRALLLLAVLIFLLPGAAGSTHAGKSLPAAIVSRDPLSWDPTLAISASEAIKRHRQKQGLKLVDVRTIADWSTVRIPGAMHIPLDFVKTKAFLKGRPIVLVGRGHDSVALLATCRDINAKGFKARMLAGGIQAWLAAEGPLAGNPAALIPQREIRPGTFYIEKNITERPVLFVGADGTQAEIDALIPYALKISPKAKPEDIKKKIEDATIFSLGRQKLPLLVCTPDGSDHERIAVWLAEACQSPLFFLEGGLKAYRDYLTGILQAQRLRKNRLKTVGGCQGCGTMDTPVKYEAKQ